MKVAQEHGSGALVGGNSFPIGAARRPAWPGRHSGHRYREYIRPHQQAALTLPTPMGKLATFRSMTEALSMTDTTSPRSLAHPRYWPTWLSIGLMRLGAWLPWSLKLAVGRAIGWLAWRFGKRRRHITETNLRLCFPELDEHQRAGLVKSTFLANGIGILETATGWCRDPEHLRHRVTFRGEEHMHRALAQGKGALIIGIHFSTLDLGGALHSLYFPADVVYRPHDNALFERFMTRARSRIFGQAIDRRDLRGVVRRIKAGHAVWYSPDQDFGRDASVFAPFFGVEAVFGILTGGLVSGVQLAISMSNSGGAWDNAKKYISGGFDPDPALRKKDGNGNSTPAHDAAVTGDTVGDPFKDTSGPALNILMKLMAILSLVFAQYFESINGGKGLFKL